MEVFMEGVKENLLDVVVGGIEGGKYVGKVFFLF